MEVSARGTLVKEKKGEKGGKLRNSNTIFLTHFVDSHDVTHLWGIFRRWGMVCNLFISRRRSKEGKHYDFVRFGGVNDPRKLEKNLQCICIGDIWTWLWIHRDYGDRVQPKGGWWTTKMKKEGKDVLTHKQFKLGSIHGSETTWTTCRRMKWHVEY